MIDSEGVIRYVVDSTGKIFMGDLPEICAEIMQQIRCAGFDSSQESVQQVMCLAEEVGEFVGAYRRWAGMARRSGPWSDVEDELADVIIVAMCTADAFGIDIRSALTRKLHILVTRGWKTPV